MKWFYLIAAAVLFTSAPAYAHHGTSASYDENKVVKFEGVVKEFRWRNPHSALFLTGKDAAGKEMTYAIEMGSPATLSRAGYTRNNIKAGDKAVVEVYPSYTNPANGYSPTSLQMVINGTPMRRSGRGEAQ